MTLERFQQMIATGKPLAGEEMITFMREQSDATRRLLFALSRRNCRPVQPDYR